MKFKRQILTVVTVCTLTMFVTMCGNKNERPHDITVSKKLKIAVYAATEVEGKFIPVGSPVLQENVSLNKLLHYDRDGDMITVPFQFKDSAEYAKITEANVGKRIVITADGEVVSAPMVKMRIGNGACSFLLTKEQAKKLLPKEKIEKLLSESN